MKITSADKRIGSVIVAAMLTLGAGHVFAQTPNTPAAVRAACVADARGCAQIVAAAIAANPRQADAIAAAGAAASGERATAAGPTAASAN